MNLYIDLAGNPRAYTKRPPVGATPLGTIAVGDACGALYRLNSGIYARVVGRDYIEKLDEVEVEAAIVEARTRSTVAGIVPVRQSPPMRLRSVSLDDATADTLRAYGGGNLSGGIRKAADLVRTCGLDT